AKVPEPSAAELGQFYTNQQATYREPDQMQVKYLLFNVTNFMAEAKQQIGVTNLSRETQEALIRIGTNTLRYGRTPEEVREKISEILVQETAKTNAMEKAVAFQNDLAKQKTVNADTMAALAREKGLEVKTSKPFDKEYGPSDLNLGPDYPVAELFNLSADDPFVPEPIRGADGVYIVAFDKLIPSRIPPLAEIHNRVVADYKLNQALRLAQINGHIFGQTVTNQMTQGKTFAAASAALKVESLEVPPFSLNTEMVPDVEDRVDLNTFKEVVFGTAAGKTSGFIPTHDGGFVVYVQKKLPIDEAKMKAGLPEFANLVRQRREAEAFQIWASQEANMSLANIPMLQQQAK
ncbi:MAG TPA: peptidylprolyl isomerase, partial [Candidatus Polarisedimenticolia bacterium]|nr:peptidylprolyl isomerase [Candidatus Polarisedimenticolia bacterium]